MTAATVDFALVAYVSTCMGFCLGFVTASVMLRRARRGGRPG